jgi:hypothetical protein
MLFCKDGSVDGQQSREGLKGMEAWLACLDLARCSKDELSLRQALEFAHSRLPFIPKEAWQVAKMLSEISGLRRDKDAFQDLDLMRKSG